MNNVGIDVRIYSPQEIKTAPQKERRKRLPSFALSRIAATQSRPARYEKKRKHLFSGIVSCRCKNIRLCSIIIIAQTFLFFNKIFNIYYIIILIKNSNNDADQSIVLAIFSYSTIPITLPQQ